MDLSRFRRLVRNHMKAAAREEMIAADADPRRWPLAVRMNRRPDRLARFLVEFSAVMGVSADAVRGRTRIRPVVITRHVFGWFLAECSGMTLSAIGDFLNRDHSSVVHARNNVAKLLDVHDPEITFAVEAANQLALEIWPPINE